MAYTEVFYPKLPMEGCADRIQDVIVRSGFSNGQVSERYRLETPGGSVLVLVLVKYLHRTGSEMVVTAVLDELEGRLRLHLTGTKIKGGRQHCINIFLYFLGISFNYLLDYLIICRRILIFI